MQLTKELLSARRVQYVEDVEKFQANLQALHGAIQDIDYWLAELEKPEESENGI